MDLVCYQCNKSFLKCDSEYKRQIKLGRSTFFCSLSCSATFGLIQQKNKNTVVYLQNPKKCKFCNNIIPYEKRNNLCCSSKCARLNFLKTAFRQKFSNDTKCKISNSIKQYWKESGRLKPIVVRLCKECKIVKLGVKKQICENCKFQYYKFYRPLCEFDFDMEDYPEKFDLTLIKNHGKYSPKNKGNNLNGVSRDHLYCVKDGFKNKVDPFVIKHPANCKLVIHKENQQKYNNSSISLEELEKRIKNWI